jgi:glutamate formiminotransferase
MSTQLVECVPNFSEGRDEDLITEIVQCFRDAPGCWVLDSRADRDHNRLVVSLAGDPAGIQEGLLAASEVAVERIDMNAHQGGHPRIGAVDVIPFVPLRDISMEACVDLARKFGERFFERTGVPVYFYEDAVLRPERRRLEVVRKGQFEALREDIGREERHPDVGPPKIHPTAGATVIGARKFLIALNVNLGTRDVSVAKTIAKAVKASSGGLCHVKGIGLALEEQGLTQVSMNIVDYEKNALYRVVELIRMEARRWGVSVVETEVYGMVPAAALLDSLAYYMQLNAFSPEQVVELAMLKSGA